MTALRELATVSSSLQNATRADKFIELARIYAITKGSIADCELLAEQRKASTVVREIFTKAAVSPGLLSDATWGSDLTAFAGLAGAFVESLRGISVFDSVLPSMRHLPLGLAAAVVSVGASGAAAEEGAWKPIGRLTIQGGDQLTARKAVAAIVTSNELMRSLASEATALLRGEIQAAVAAVTDSTFLNVLTDGLTPISSLGNTAVREDLASMLAAVRVGQRSRLFIIMHGDNAKALAVMGGDNGFAFPQMAPQGGSIAGIPVLVADAIDEDDIILLDASQIAAAPGTVTLSSAQHASMRLSDDPESDSALTSLFQKSLVGLKAERWFGCHRLRDSAVAVLTGAAYGETITV